MSLEIVPRFRPRLPRPRPLPHFRGRGGYGRYYGYAPAEPYVIEVERITPPAQAYRVVRTLYSAAQRIAYRKAFYGNTPAEAFEKASVDRAERKRPGREVLQLQRWATGPSGNGAWVDVASRP